MKENVHPNYIASKVTCACGNKFDTRSVLSEIHVEICSSCHPFFTGKHKLMDTAGRIEKFQRRYANVKKD
jgi:large subunit ribosomal protein L31